jgi:hypothetical protein
MRTPDEAVPLRPEPGDRYTDYYNGRVMEWHGGAWTPVCSVCGTAMTAHDPEGWLSCGTCDRRAVDDPPRKTSNPSIQEIDMTDLATMTEHDIRRDIEADELAYGPEFAHAGEAALKPGDTIYNFDGKPATVTRVAGRRFIWATSEAYPEPHLIDCRSYTTNPRGYDPHDTLVELVQKHEQFRTASSSTPDQQGAAGATHPTPQEEPMSAPLGEALTIEQTRTNLDTLNTWAQGEVDTASAAAIQAQNVAAGVEQMTANMSGQSAHPDTLGDMAGVLEAAQAVENAAQALSTAAATMHAAVVNTAQGVNQRDGLVAEVGASVGNVAERDYLRQ